jgi:hypothetical protein
VGQIVLTDKKHMTNLYQKEMRKDKMPAANKQFGKIAGSVLF